MKILLKIALRNVILHWRQSLAATISLAAGLISLVMFQGYMKDVRHMYQETFRSRMMYGDVIIEHKNLVRAEGRAEPWKYSLKDPDQKFVQNFLNKYTDRIDSAAKFLQISGMVTNGKTTTIFRGFGNDIKAAQKTRGEAWAWNTLYGTPLKEEQKHTAILGQSLGKILGCYPDKKEKVMNAVAGYKPEVRPFHCIQKDVQLNVTTETGQLNAIDLEAVGLVDALYKDIDDKYIVTSLEDAQALMNTQDLSYITVKFKDEGPHIDAVIEDFTKSAAAAGIPQRMVRWENHIVGDMYNRTMNLLSVFRNFVVSIILVIAGLSVFNTMMKLVKERTREIGTLRSIGFVPNQVLLIFIGESVILSLLGGGIGSVLAVLSTFAMNALGIVYKAGVLVEPVPFRIMISMDLYILSFVFLSLLATFATWIVCRSTLKVETAENLIHH